MRSGRDGFSLIELAVASGLLMFLMGGLYLVMVGGTRHYQQGVVYQTVQQQAAIGMRKMVNELENTRAQSVYALDTPAPHVIFPSADQPHPAAAGQWSNDPGTNRLVWQKWVCYYHDSVAEELVRTELLLSPLPTDDPPVEGDPDYPDYATMTTTPDHELVIAREIYALDFDVNVFSGGWPSIDVDLSAREETASDKSTQVNLSNRVFPRNSDGF